MRVLLAKIIRGYLFVRRGRKEVWVGGVGGSRVTPQKLIMIMISDDEVVPGRPAVAP